MKDLAANDVIASTVKEIGKQFRQVTLIAYQFISL